MDLGFTPMFGSQETLFPLLTAVFGFLPGKAGIAEQCRAHVRARVCPCVPRDAGPCLTSAGLSVHAFFVHNGPMLDAQLFVKDVAATRHSLSRRGLEPAWLDETVALIDARRLAQQAKEVLQQQQNAASQDIQTHVRQGNKEALTKAKEAVKTLKGRVQAAEAAFAEADQAAIARLLEIPNLPADHVPDGRSEADNREVHRHGTAPSITAPKAHYELGEQLGIVDFERASKASGPRFSYLTGAAARLERAVANFMLDQARAAGFLEVSPPLLVRPDAMQQAGQYPKFIGESFETQQRDYVLIPTSEVPLVAMHAQEILAEEALPLRMTALTPCFRREAGAAGRDTRGLIRQHQFYKVEMVSLTTPETSEQEHQALRAHAEGLLRALDLHFRTVHLCTGDMGFAARSTYDLEVWLPAQQTFREISSISNCGDFQARRALIRCRRGGAGGDASHKPRLVHTLNGSALAVGRTLVAILENYQRDDGGIQIPAVLQPYLGGQTRIAPRDMATS